NCEKNDRLHGDCKALAGFNREAREAGIVVASSVIAVINTAAVARITGSDAWMAYTRLETSWPEKKASDRPITAPTTASMAPCFRTRKTTDRGEAPSASRVATSPRRRDPAYDTPP